MRKLKKKTMTSTPNQTEHLLSSPKEQKQMSTYDPDITSETKPLKKQVTTQPILDDELVSKLKKGGPILIIVMLLTGLAGASGASIGFEITGGFYFELVAMVFVLLVSLAGAIVGAYGVQLFFPLGEQLELIIHDNQQLQSKACKWREDLSQIESQVGYLRNANKRLATDFNSLEKQMQQFDVLKRQLTESCGDNEDLNQMLDTVNSGFGAMKTAIVNNERAALLSMYYDVERMDGEAGLSKREYMRFYGRLSTAHRLKFDEFGDFKTLAGDDDKIDLEEMQGYIERLLTEMEDELVFKQR